MVREAEWRTHVAALDRRSRAPKPVAAEKHEADRSWRRVISRTRPRTVGDVALRHRLAGMRNRVRLVLLYLSKRKIDPARDHRRPRARSTTAVKNKYYVDEGVNFVVIKPTMLLCTIFRSAGLDENIVDGFVLLNGVERPHKGLSAFFSAWFDKTRGRRRRQRRRRPDHPGLRSGRAAAADRSRAAVRLLRRRRGVASASRRFCSSAPDLLHRSRLPSPWMDNHPLLDLLPAPDRDGGRSSSLPKRNMSARQGDLRGGDVHPAGAVDRGSTSGCSTSRHRRATSSCSACSWIPPLGAQYHVGIDGLRSLPLVWLTTLLLFIAVPGQPDGIPRRCAEGVLRACCCCSRSASLGVFVSLDYFLFYVFWEMMLLPMYFLIGIWGGPKREYAAIKFFLYTLTGSVLMLVAIVALRLDSGTFSIPEMMNLARSGQLTGASRSCCRVGRRRRCSQRLA